jgi:hypothetical protein
VEIRQPAEERQGRYGSLLLAHQQYGGEARTDELHPADGEAGERLEIQHP